MVLTRDAIASYIWKRSIGHRRHYSNGLNIVSMESPVSQSATHFSSFQAKMSDMRAWSIIFSKKCSLIWFAFVYFVNASKSKSWLVFHLLVACWNRQVFDTRWILHKCLLYWSKNSITLDSRQMLCSFDAATVDRRISVLGSYCFTRAECIAIGWGSNAQEVSADILPKSEGVLRVNLLLAITPVAKPTIADKQLKFFGHCIQ